MQTSHEVVRALPSASREMVPASQRAVRPGTRLLRKPPRVIFHVLAVLPAGAGFLSQSVPGGDPDLALVAELVVPVFGLVWVVRLVAYLWARIRHRHAGPARWFAVAPAMLVLTVATVSTALPLQIRWWLGRPDFDAVVANAPPTPPAPAEPLTIAVAAPGRVGTYGVRAVAKRRDALLFMERNSNFDYSSLQCGDGGFAYLPGGPFDAREFAALNNPRFSSLGDGWYWFWDPCINP